ncbi:MAG: hypothetical protein EOO41_01045 [Methanobacteriota archaeon]|nr:MAG: hypothetical protein EOO41_01045 [Euryarchaeota archaeon]
MTSGVRTCAAGSAWEAAVAQCVKSLAKEHSVGGIVFGWPLDPQGGVSPQCALVRRIIQHMQSQNVRAARV